MKLSFMTHRGAVRAANQDALQIAERIFTGDMDAPQTVQTEKLPLLLSVVDGLGGHRGGERAAAILAGSLSEGASAFGKQLNTDADSGILRSLLKTAEARMNGEAERNRGLSGMGATAAGLLIREESVLAFNCGDCRAYRFSRGVPEKLTHDHSVVQKLFDKGEITEEEMRFHPRKNIVSSAVIAMSRNDFELYVRPLSRVPDDSFFICTDGVWESLSLEETARLLMSPDAPADLFEAMIRVGCHDNVSFIIVQPQGFAVSPLSARDEKVPHGIRTGCE